MISNADGDWLTMSYVYELQQINVWGRYPSRNIGYLTVGLFDTCDHAKEAMHDFIRQEMERWVHLYGDEKEYYKNCLGYYIRERTVYNHLTLEYVEVIRFRSYTADGELIDYNDINELGQFTGRKPQNIRFKVGDIVEVIQNRRLELAIVGSLPPTEEWVKERTEYCREHYPDRPLELDDTDDSYTVYFIGEGDTHSHPSCTSVFRPSKKIPAGIVKKLKDKLQEMKRM